MTTTKTGQGNVNEGNRIIAEFDGYIYKADSYGEPVFSHPRYDKKASFPLSGFQYHTSWDWLMPVYIKLKDTQSKYSEIVSYKHYMKAALMEGNITLLHKEIVNFINWLNSNK